jgi:PAS domain S-box-containing protein
LATSTLLGVDRKDLIDKGLSSFVSPRSHESLYLHYRRVVQGKDRRVHTFSIQRKGGKNIQVRFESNLVEGESDTGFRSILTDVTELKKAEDALMESEARYRSLFKDNNAPMLLIDPSTGNIVDANQQACDFYGYEYENLRNMKIFDINTLNPEKVDSEMGKSLSREKGHFNFRHQLANGEVHDVEVYSGPIYIEGRPLLYSIIHDVTDRMRIEEELRKRTKELARSNAELQQFAYVASHDLQEPLRMVVGFLSLFERKYTKDLHPKAQEYIKSAVEGGTRMRELVDDLLEYSIPNVINSCE